MQALKIAATGMLAQQQRVAVVSNNIANMSTTAFAPRRAEFADLFYEQLQRPGAAAADNGSVQPTGVQVGLGVRTVSIAMDMKQGTLKQTENEFDLALQGRGWFEVQLPDGTSAFTRDGSFRKGPDGLIVTAEGYPLIPEITVPDDARQVTITGEGLVSATFAGAIEALNSFIDSHPESPFVANALYWSGESLYSLGRLDAARRVFQSVVSEYPRSFRVEAARYRIALIDLDERETELLELLRWSHEEYLQALDEFERREQAYQEAISSYQQQLSAVQDAQDAGTRTRE